ncbi:MAG TPA: CAP domain-containing protein [Candidatus Saccharimonas sp.]|nr:CAP domain-containing protein [Candidatus Saccharimonas sp.]
MKTKHPRLVHRVKHYLKHWLVPHRHNDHRPHLIRRHGLALVVAVLLGVHTAAYLLVPAAVRTANAQSGRVLAYATDINPVDLFNLTNQERVNAGLPALKLDATLNHSAALKAADMFQYDYWAHDNPTTGAEPWYWFTQAGYNYQYAGENLAMNFDTSAGTMDGWMNSPGHKANILNVHYTDVGFAVVNGTLQGNQTTLVVAHYGVRQGAAATVTATVAPAKPSPVTPPTPTPTPTPALAVVTTPSPSLSPTPVPTLAVISAPQLEAPAPKSYSLFAPLSITATLNWAMLVTLALLVLLFGVFSLTHLTAWSQGLRRWRSLHYRAIAAAQVGGVATLIVYVATSGLGRVG